MAEATKEKMKPAEKTSRIKAVNYEHIKIPLIYLAMGILWVYFSDRLANNTITDKEVLLWVNTYKGWLYVFVTSLVLYFLLSRFSNRVDAVETQLRKSNAALMLHYNQIKISESNFRELFEGSSDAILIVSGNRIMDCNPAAISLFGYSSKEPILNKTVEDLSPVKQANGKLSKETAEAMYRESIKNGKSKFEWQHKRADGSLTLAEVMMTTIVLNGEKVFHCLCRDIDERKQMEHQLKHMAEHDQLTDLYNRRFFEEALLLLDTPESWPIAVIIADINGLKLINDSFGHEAGDGIIKEVAEIIRNDVRKSDIACRLAGDEFIILCPNTDNGEAIAIIQKIKVSAAKTKYGQLDISISLGYEIKKGSEDSLVAAIKNAEDYMNRKKLYDNPSMRSKTIGTIITTLHEKNKREEQHSQRVSYLCEMTGIALGLQEDQVKELRTVGLLHDIGKIGIDESILNKNGKLTSKEYEEIQKHPEIGYRILSTVNDLSEMAEYVLAHHERWDGKGYPKGIAGDEIPLQSSIIAIADAYDAMISERSYRTPLTKEEAIQELIAHAGTQFNPECVKVFIEKVLIKE